MRVDPCDGATGVFRDAPVVVTLSHPVERASVGPLAVRITAEGDVPGRLVVSPDGAVVIWTPDAPLGGSTTHVVDVSGLSDRGGREVCPHRSRFTTGDHALADLTEERTK